MIEIKNGTKTENDDVTYKINNGEWTVLKAKKNLNVIKIESEIKGYPVTKIGYCAFDDCDKVETIIVDKDNPIFDSRDNCNAIIETKTNNLVFGCKNTKIPSSVTSIGEFAFRGCKSLKNIKIPSSITSIGERAFDGCTSLKNIEIPNSVTSIGYDAFLNCGVNWIDDLNLLLKKCIKMYYGNKNSKINSNKMSFDEFDQIDSTVFEDDKFFNIFKNEYFNHGSIYYTGTPEEAKQAFEDDVLPDVLCYSEYKPEINPEKYWHRVNGVPTRWRK